MCTPCLVGSYFQRGRKAPSPMASERLPQRSYYEGVGLPLDLAGTASEYPVLHSSQLERADSDSPCVGESK